MPSLRLTLPQAWYDEVAKQARETNQTPQQLILGLLALSIPPPRSGRAVDAILEFQQLTTQVENLCCALTNTRNEVLKALADLVPPRGANPRVHARRKHVAGLLKAAMKRAAVKQKDIAQRIGVTRQSVSEVLCARKSLPAAWIGTLDEILGKGWLDERVA